MDSESRIMMGKTQNAHLAFHINSCISGETELKGRWSLSYSKHLETLGYNRSNRLCHDGPVRLFEQVWRTIRGFHSVSGCRPSLVGRVDNE